MSFLIIVVWVVVFNLWPSTINVVSGDIDKNEVIEFYKSILTASASNEGDIGGSNFFLIIIKKFLNENDRSSIDDIYKPCYDDLNVYIESLNRKEDWALKMFDSSAAVNSGFLRGNLVNFGDFEECTNVLSEKNKIAGLMSNIIFYLSEDNYSNALPYKQMVFGICLPENCQYYLEYILRKSIPFRSTFEVWSVINSSPIETKDYYIITFFATLFGIILISTLYDLFKYNNYCKLNDEDLNHSTLHNRSKLEGGLLSFSLIRNVKLLLEEDKKDDSIKALHGLRVIGACGVSIIHRHLLDMQPFTNVFHIDEELRKWYRLIQINTYLWVDTFLLISGLLITYTFLRKRVSLSKRFILKYYLHRYIRLTPTLFVVLLISLSTDQMCSGDLCSFLLYIFKDRCVQNGWLNLFYINNIIDQMNMCMIQTWYTAVDMQLYLFSPVILFILNKRTNCVIFNTLLVLLAAHIAYVFTLSYKYDLYPTILESEKISILESSYIYNQALGRAGPWIMGLGLGIVLHWYNQEPIKLSKITVIFCWLLAITCILAAQFSLAPIHQKDYVHKPILECFVKAMTRNVWALGFMWIIYACYTGYGGWLNKFLSSYNFQPLSKVTYSFYLIHTMGQFFTIQSGDVPRHYSDMSQLYLYMGDIIVGFTMAIPLYLAVEAPACNLDRVFFTYYANEEVEEPKRTVKVA